MLSILTLAALIAPTSPTPVPAAQPALVRADGEAVQLETRDRLKIGATYYAPRSKKNRAPGVVLVHDAGADQSQVADIASYLNKKGFGVINLDLRGHGSSISEQADWNTLKSEDERERLWTFAAKDLAAASNFLRDQREIHASNISVVGIGAGCSLAVRHAMDDENTRAVVLISPNKADWGYNLAQGVSDLEGLPTLICAAKADRDDATRLQTAGHDANGGSVYIQVAVMKSKDAVALEDSRLRRKVNDFLRDELMPTKRR